MNRNRHSASQQCTLDALTAEVRACRLCEAHLPLGPRPVFRTSPTARILIVGQAPGTRVHATGIPWNDPSGQRLRHWLDMPPEVFYDDRHIAIVPMGLCYPGRNPRGGDLPPRPECAPAWHAPLLAHMPQVRMTLLIGLHAQRHYLGVRRARSLTETVQRWQEFTPTHWPLPHPSWRNTRWLRDNPWFEAKCLPALRAQVHAVLKAP